MILERWGWRKHDILYFDGWCIAGRWISQDCFKTPGSLKPVDLHTCYLHLLLWWLTWSTQTGDSRGVRARSRESVFTHTRNSACVKGAWWHTTQAVMQSKFCQHACDHFNTSVPQWSEVPLLQFKNPQPELQVLNYHPINHQRGKWYVIQTFK